jgi:hypothetical protein
MAESSFNARMSLADAVTVATELRFAADDLKAQARRMVDTARETGVAYDAKAHTGLVRRAGAIDAVLGRHFK